MYQYIITLLLSTSALTCMHAQSIRIAVEGIDHQQGGQVSAGLYRGADGWTEPGKQIAGSAAAISKEGTTVLTFDNVKPGLYAIALMHDANSNNMMDKSFIGLPQEGYAFSQNAFGRLGPPSFDRCSFEVVDGQTTALSITLKY